MTRALSDTNVSVSVKTIEINAGDPIVVPDEFQQALGLDQGGTYTAIQLDGLVIVTPKRLESLDALEGMRRVFEDGNITLDDLLAGLDLTREQIYNERYARPSKPT